MKALKRVESTLRYRIVEAAARVAGRTRPLPAWGVAPQRVLLLRHDAIGDTIIATGVARAIATSHPRIEVDLVTSSRSATILDGNPYVRRAIVRDRRNPTENVALLGRLYRERYDVVIDMILDHPSISTLALMLATRATHRIGVSGRGNEQAFTYTVPPLPRTRAMVEQWGQVALPFGVDVDTYDFRPTIVLSSEERRRAAERWATLPGGNERRILVNLSASEDARRWPDERFAELLRTLKSRHAGARVLAMAPLAERSRASAIAAAGGVDLATPEALRDGVALVATTDLVFTPATSICHMASAFCTPTVAMHQAGDEKYTAYRTPGEVIWSDTQRLDRIGTGTAIDAISRVLTTLEGGVGARG